MLRIKFSAGRQFSAPKSASSPSPKPSAPSEGAEHGFCVSGRTVRLETFEQLINVGVGRQFSVSKAPLSVVVLRNKGEHVLCIL